MRRTARPADSSIAPSLIALSLLLLPHAAGAFWPFSTPVDAAAGAVIPSASTPALFAAANLDPTGAPPSAIALSGDSALLAYAGPGGTLADIASAPPSDRISVYEVRAGDTLSEIAALYGVSVNTIIWANNLGSARDLHPGDTLIILPVSGVERTVRAGDTLSSLAKKYGADKTEIAEFNGLDPAAPLSEGATLIIPGGELSVPPRARAPRGSSAREPYLGGSGAALPSFFTNPLPGGRLTQGVHGWNAVDLGSAPGTPVRAAASGTVIIVRNNGLWNGGYGNYVVITHDNGVQTLYAHLSRAIVSPGESVGAGEVVGFVGLTGMTTGPHLHFEVRGAANPFRNCTVGAFCSPQ